MFELPGLYASGRTGKPGGGISTPDPFANPPVVDPGDALEVVNRLYRLPRLFSAPAVLGGRNVAVAVFKRAR